MRKSTEARFFVYPFACLLKKKNPLPYSVSLYVGDSWTDLTHFFCAAPSSPEDLLRPTISPQYFLSTFLLSVSFSSFLLSSSSFKVSLKNSTQGQKWKNLTFVVIETPNRNQDKTWCLVTLWKYVQNTCDLLDVSGDHFILKQESREVCLHDLLKEWYTTKKEQHGKIPKRNSFWRGSCQKNILAYCSTEETNYLQIVSFASMNNEYS